MAATNFPAHAAAQRFSASATPLMKPTTALRVRPAASSSPIAPSPACSVKTGRAPRKSLNCSLPNPNSPPSHLRLGRYSRVKPLMVYVYPYLQPSLLGPDWWPDLASSSFSHLRASLSLENENSFQSLGLP